MRMSYDDEGSGCPNLRRSDAKVYIQPIVNALEQSLEVGTCRIRVIYFVNNMPVDERPLFRDMSFFIVTGTILEKLPEEFGLAN